MTSFHKLGHGMGTFLLVGFAALGWASTASAGIHTWDVNEVFSNADGSIQFVELRENGPPPGSETGVGNGTISSNTQTYVMSEGAVTAPTSGKHFLIATAAFAALPGAPTPDAIIPPANIPFFAPASDSVAFGGFDTLVVTGAPTNGTDSYGVGGVVAVNSPTNYAGVSGSVNAAPPGPPARTLTMSGEWFQNRGQLIDIPINGGVVFCGGGGVGEPIGIGGCLGAKFGVVNATGMVQGLAMFKQANGGIPAPGGNISVNGGAPASFTVPPGAFGQNLGAQVVALPINATVQQLSTQMPFNGPPTSNQTSLMVAGNDGLTAMNWQAKFQANAFSQDPGQVAAGRIQKSFTWCPGVGGAACSNAGLATGTGGPNYNGLVRYKNPGGNGFGGTMAMMSQSGGYVSLALTKQAFGIPTTAPTGMSRAMAHQAFGSIGGTISRPAWPGLGYNAVRVQNFPGAPIYQNFGINTACVPNVLPPSPANCSQIVSQGPPLSLMIGPSTTIPLGIPPDQNINFGFPWTTGTVTAQHTGVTAMGGADTETLSAMGYDNRTPAGAGRIVMVAGAVSHRFSAASSNPRNFSGLDVVRLDFSTQVPTMSAPAIGAVVTLMLLAGGYMARRRFPSGVSNS